MATRHATLRDLRAEIEVVDQAVTVDDPYLLDALRFVSARIEAIAEQPFAPLVQTRYYDALGDHIDDGAGVLYLDHPLLAVSEVLDGAGNALLEGVDFRLYPRGETPHSGLLLLAGGSLSRWSSYATDWQEAIQVTGVWGYRRAWDTAWVDSLDTVQDDPLPESATTVQVSDASGADAWARAPRFSPGQLIGLESEYCEVEAVDVVTNRLTVVRGARGSVAAQHAQGTPVMLFEPEPVIVRATLRWAAYLYRRRGQFQRVQFDGVATTEFPPDVPEEVAGILAAIPPPHPGWYVV